MSTSSSSSSSDHAKNAKRRNKRIVDSSGDESEKPRAVRIRVASSSSSSGPRGDSIPLDQLEVGKMYKWDGEDIWKSKIRGSYNGKHVYNNGYTNYYFYVDKYNPHQAFGQDQLTNIKLCDEKAKANAARDAARKSKEDIRWEEDYDSNGGCRGEKRNKKKSTQRRRRRKPRSV